MGVAKAAVRMETRCHPLLHIAVFASCLRTRGYVCQGGARVCSTETGNIGKRRFQPLEAIKDFPVSALKQRAAVALT